MNYTIEKNRLTDKLGALDQQIKNTNTPIPLQNKGIIYIISGKKGTGKSSLLLNLLKTKQIDGGLKKYYDNIYLISPTAKTDAKFKKLVIELDEDDKYFEDCNEENLNEIMNNIKENIKENDEIRNLIILDDCIADLPKSNESSVLNKIVSISRHLQTSIFILVQKYIGVNNLIRRNADLLSFFRTDNKKEIKSLSEDINIEEAKLKFLYNIAMQDDKPNDFLHINLLNTPVLFYKQFDKIII